MQGVSTVFLVRRVIALLLLGFLHNVHSSDCHSACSFTNLGVGNEMECELITWFEGPDVRGMDTLVWLKESIDHSIIDCVRHL